jgi:tRNA dimethylallyltransferase
MLVYQGMDIGTAKPSLKERGDVIYYGIDLVLPIEQFSTGKYLEYVRSHVMTQGSEKGLIVVGGTGLYLRALLEGLPGSAAPSEAIRGQVQAILETEGLEGLCRALRDRDPVGLENLDDPMNPRRVQRALEYSLAELPPPHAWLPASHPPVPGLCYPREVLAERILRRVHKMFEAGLLDEVRSLRSEFGDLSVTAAVGIGYDEAGAVLDGVLSREEAIEQTATRTRRLAKRQMSWFNHQANVNWIEITPGDSTESIATRVSDTWSRTGPIPLNGLRK